MWALFLNGTRCSRAFHTEEEAWHRRAKQTWLMKTGWKKAPPSRAGRVGNR